MSRIVRSMATLTVVVVVVVVAACGGGGVATPDSSSSVGSQVVLSDFRFDPDELLVTAGYEVKMELSHGGGIIHTWSLLATERAPASVRDVAATDLLFEATVDPGGSVVVFFDAPDRSGTYAVICTIPGHVEAGMVGELIVTG